MNSITPSNHKEVLGVTVLDIPIELALENIRSFSFPSAPSSSPKIIVTPNIDHISRLHAKEDPKFNAAYNTASIVLCDSRVVRLISRFGRNPLNYVVPGSDLTRRLLREEWLTPLKTCVIGTTAEEYETITARYGITNSVHYNPPMGFINNPDQVKECLDFIFESKPQIILLAIGSPRQEILAKKIKLLSEERTVTDIKVILCIGASLDFLSGKTSRAPKWMQILSIEWLHRALSDPLRLIPRYFRNLVWLSKYLISSLINRVSVRP